MGHDEIIDALAATQHGVVARQQLLAAGFTRHAVDHRLSTGRLVHLHAGVYLVRGHPDSLLARLTGAYVAAGTRSVVSHRGAAALLGLAGVEPQVEVTVLVSQAPRIGALVHRTTSLPLADVDRSSYPPRTRPARTLIDLAAVVEPPTLARALNDALNRRLVTCPYLQRRLAAIGTQGRRGVTLLAALIAEQLGSRERHQSDFERQLFSILEAAGLPLPVPQFEVHLPGGGRVFLDFAYPEPLVAIEADSYRHHSSHEDWARDHKRNRILTAMGWRILPATWDDLAQPAALIEVVRRSLHVLPPLAG